MSKEAGFNLIELMVVIAIMAVLAAIAIPAYSHHINRSRAVSAVVITDPVRTAVTEYAMTHNGALTDVSNVTLNMDSNSIVEGSNDVVNVNIQSAGANSAVITAALADNLGTLTWTGTYNTANGHMSWQCTYLSGSPLSHYAPHNCTAAS
jgi:type IV pilus assembly protein PilA